MGRLRVRVSGVKNGWMRRRIRSSFCGEVGEIRSSFCGEVGKFAHLFVVEWEKFAHLFVIVLKISNFAQKRKSHVFRAKNRPVSQSVESF